MDNENIVNDNEILVNIENELKDINKSLKVILCCSLLPKDGPNWDFYESLFESAEKMVSESDGLVSMVKEVLLPLEGSANQSCQNR